MTPRSGVVVAAVAFLFSFSACNRVDDEQAPREGDSLEAIRADLKALEDRFGEDAYSSAEAQLLLRRLAKLPEGSPDLREAARLAAWVRAKAQLRHQATEAPGPDPKPEDSPSFGPRMMGKTEPQTKEELAAAEEIAVGSLRDELMQRYSGCLVRQTWFRGSNGGATTELFQTTPKCRDRLSPRIFTVMNGKVSAVSTGNVDAVMSGKSEDTPPTGAGEAE